MGREVQLEAAELHPVFSRRPLPGALGSAQNGPDASEQLAWIERLADVVIGTHLEPDDAVDVLTLGRDDDDGDVAVRLQSAGDREPMLPGQHQIENDEVHVVGFEVGVHRLAAVDAVHLEPLLAEIGLRQLTNLGVVVND